MKKIEFTDINNSGLEKPVPASKILPEWYKNQKSYTKDNDTSPINGNMATIKKCIPVFDSISSGYIISTSVDIYVSTDQNGEPAFTSAGQKYLDGHDKIQFSEYNLDYARLPKILNSWSIKTPQGYSCLFLPPLHRDNIIEILPAIVDTDSYNLEINFPFKLKDKSFNGLIPAGTPIAQVIPFKRDNWESVLNEPDVKWRIEFSRQLGKFRRMFFGSYKNLFWNKKVFK